MKNRNLKFIILALTALLIGLVCVSSVNIFAVRETPKEPKLVIKLSAKIITSGNSFDNWLYVVNPSDNMETTLTVPREIIHTVLVQSLTMTLEDPDGDIDVQTFTPTNPSQYAYRWDPIVYPLEESLVYWGGWQLIETGLWDFTYELAVEFEGEIYTLIETFKIVVVD